MYALHRQDESDDYRSQSTTYPRLFEVFFVKSLVDDGRLLECAFIAQYAVCISGSKARHFPNVPGAFPFLKPAAVQISTLSGYASETIHSHLAIAAFELTAYSPCIESLS